MSRGGRGRKPPNAHGFDAGPAPGHWLEGYVAPSFGPYVTFAALATPLSSLCVGSYPARATREEIPAYFAR